MPSPSSSRASISCGRSCSSPRANRCPGARTTLVPARPRDRGARLRRGSRDADSFPRPAASLLYREPRMPGVRVDAGVGRGQRCVRSTTIRCSRRSSPSAETRELAIARLSAALRAVRRSLGVRPTCRSCCGSWTIHAFVPATSTPASSIARALSLVGRRDDVRISSAPRWPHVRRACHGSEVPSRHGADPGGRSLAP